MKSPMLTLASIIISLSASTFAIAGADSSGHVCFPYITVTNGKILRDNDGHCVRTGTWTPDRAIAECARAMPSSPKTVNTAFTLSAGALFDHDSAVIKTESTSELNDIADHIKNRSDVQAVEITGHTDSRGSAQYNDGLSMRRATSVKNYLIDHGVSPTVISTSGMGENQPVATNESAEGRAKNRRVEINVKSDN